MTRVSGALPRSRSARAWVFLAGAILLEVTGSMCLKAALDHPALYAVVAVGYVGSFVCLGRVLALGMPLGVAYGIWGATGVALTAGLSTAIFHEPFTTLMGAGIVCIIGGVLLVELGSQAAHRKSAHADHATEGVEAGA